MKSVECRGKKNEDKVDIVKVKGISCNKIKKNFVENLPSCDITFLLLFSLSSLAKL